MESGAILPNVHVAYQTYGRLSAGRDNAVVVCGMFGLGAGAAGIQADLTRRGWWDQMIGPGKPLDTRRWWVICADLLGGCKGSTGPASVNPATGSPYALDFPVITVRDVVAVQRRLLKLLDVSRVHAVVGGSFGGMQALQWGLDHPSEVDRVVAVASSSKASAYVLALNFAARTAIMQDLKSATPESQAGRDGLAIARMLALTSYSSEAALEEVFGRSRQDRSSQPTLEPDFAIEHHLKHWAERFAQRFDPLSYLYHSRALDYFDPFADDRLDLAGVAAVGTRFLAVSFTSDQRYPPQQSQVMIDRLTDAGVVAEHVVADSKWGHQSVVQDIASYHSAVADHVAKL